ncbi:MAG TPA: asparagine synthase (glutamine-hydrolyzing) [Bacilli bacterium]
MCGIVGWIDWRGRLAEQSATLAAMTTSLGHRGPDASGTWISGHCALGHTRLSVMDPLNGAQPMVLDGRNAPQVIVYNGELYNVRELRNALAAIGRRFRTACDTEVVLAAYAEWGESCLNRFNGIFAFGVWDEERQSLFLARDRLGVKPLFYAQKGNTFVFASEPKAILAHPAFPAEVGTEGLAEVLAIGPARTPGHGVYKRMVELKPGFCLRFTRDGICERCYWKLESRPHEDDLPTTARKVRELLEDTAKRQLISDVPVCAMLSGGLDSSALTALAAKHGKAEGRGALDTFSVDYVDNDKYFRANVFQPSSDQKWIEHMSAFAGTHHHRVMFDTPDLVASLEAAVKARDMPGMADIDGSLYLFCREIKKHATVALSGEGADEVFGGYPWFNRKELLNAGTFPWSISLSLREQFLQKDTAAQIRVAEYAQTRYRQAIAEVPQLPGESAQDKKMREMSYLNITRFMPTLLDRKDRMSMACGLEVRVPFCDHRIVQYVWNVPWSIKTAGGMEKGLLRQSLSGAMPEKVIMRKKSPYPKTHHPGYLAAVREKLGDVAADASAPLWRLFDRNKVIGLLASDAPASDLPWFGQLMGLPQMLAFLWQTNYWLRTYRVSFV